MRMLAVAMAALFGSIGVARAECPPGPDAGHFRELMASLCKMSEDSERRAIESERRYYEGGQRMYDSLVRDIEESRRNRALDGISRELGALNATIERQRLYPPY